MFMGVFSLLTRLMPMTAFGERLVMRNNSLLCNSSDTALDGLPLAAHNRPRFTAKIERGYLPTAPAMSSTDS